MQLSGGRPFWPLDPRQEDIDINSIAHALGNMCRYNGHAKRFLSVAEHSVHICRWIKKAGHDDETALWGLLHDAPEALGLADIVRPVKPYITGYKALERDVMDAVCDRFGLSHEEPAIVKEADNRILRDEYEQAMDESVLPWGFPDDRPLGVTLEFWSPGEAKVAFLQEFDALHAF